MSSNPNRKPVGIDVALFDRLTAAAEDRILSPSRLAELLIADGLDRLTPVEAFIRQPAAPAASTPMGAPDA